MLNTKRQNKAQDGDQIKTEGGGMGRSERTCGICRFEMAYDVRTLVFIHTFLPRQKIDVKRDKKKACVLFTAFTHLSSTPLPSTPSSHPLTSLMTSHSPLQSSSCLHLPPSFLSLCLWLNLFRKPTKVPSSPLLSSPLLPSPLLLFLVNTPCFCQLSYLSFVCTTARSV